MGNDMMLQGIRVSKRENGKQLLSEVKQPFSAAPIEHQNAGIANWPIARPPSPCQDPPSELGFLVGLVVMTDLFSIHTHFLASIFLNDLSR
jgi:hypothetical protein